MKIVINRSQAYGKKNQIRSNMELISILLKTILLSNWVLEK